MLLTKEQHTRTRDKQKKEKRPEESTPITWKRNVSPHSREYCFFEGRVTNQFEERASAFDIYKQILILIF